MEVDYEESPPTPQASFRRVLHHMAVKLDDERRAVLVSRLQGFYLQEFDEGLSAFRAEQVLDFFLNALGPQVYNQAVQDARGFMLRVLDDIDGEVHEPESS